MPRRRLPLPRPVRCLAARFLIRAPKLAPTRYLPRRLRVSGRSAPWFAHLSGNLVPPKCPCLPLFPWWCLLPRPYFQVHRKLQQSEPSRVPTPVLRL